jgi:hypothetical protein
MLAKANYRQSGADFAGNMSIPSLALLFVTGSFNSWHRRSDAATGFIVASNAWVEKASGPD